MPLDVHSILFYIYMYNFYFLIKYKTRPPEYIQRLLHIMAYVRTKWWFPKYPILKLHEGN